MEPANRMGDMAEKKELFGEVALGLRYISREQLEKALVEQRTALRSGFRRKLGSILIEKGFLNEAQCREVQARQVQRQAALPMAVQIGGFEIVHKLGSGGMGTVYKARQVALDRIVALKVLRGDLGRDPSICERFLSEARMLARLNHPNIVAGIAVGCDGGQYYLAMEYVDGEALSERLLTYPEGLPEGEALEYIRQVAQALQHAHNRRLLHRDIKPENILVTREGQAKLTDLGLARALNQSESKRITQQGLTVGTPHYLSPEQAQGADKLTRATDLYALGATLYHLLTGQVPYEAKTCSAVMLKHVCDPVPDPRSVRPRLSSASSSICMKLMRKSPRERYPSAIALAEDLERALKRQPLRHCERIPHPTRKVFPVQGVEAFRGHRYDTDRPSTQAGSRKGGGRGLDRLVSSIARRLGL